MRWGVPIAAIAVVGAAVGAGPVIAAAQGESSLPERTAGQLLAEVVKTGDRDEPPAMSGTVVETASLGLPSLPISNGSSASPLSLLSGSHTLKVWYGGAGRVRLALPGTMSETDLISNGEGETWLWQSETNTATRIRVPEGARAEAVDSARGALPSAKTPQDLADLALKALDPSTRVSVGNVQRVAGRAAYELVLTPRAASSLVDRVTLALDGEYYKPLRVQLFAKGAAAPALEVGFTQVTFSAPAPENFAFAPPAGAVIEEKKIDDTIVADGRHAYPDRIGVPRTFGSGWATVAEIPYASGELFTSKGGGPSRDGVHSTVVKSLLESATPVSGPFGRGKVIRSKLVSALLTDDGRLLVGAVTPEALVEAAGRR